MGRPSPAQIFARCEIAEGIAQAYREHGYTMAEIAEHLDLHYATVSRRLRRWERSAHV